MKIFYVYLKYLLDEETFEKEIKAYPMSYRKEHWKKVRVI